MFNARVSQRLKDPDTFGQNDRILEWSYNATPFKNVIIRL